MHKLKCGYQSTFQKAVIANVHPSQPKLGSRMDPGTSLSGHLSLQVLKKAGAAQKPENISELKAFTHKERVKTTKNI